MAHWPQGSAKKKECLGILPLVSPSGCRNGEAQGAGKSGGHRCRDGDAYPGLGNLHSSASRSSFVPAGR